MPKRGSDDSSNKRSSISGHSDGEQGEGKRSAANAEDIARVSFCQESFAENEKCHPTAASADAESKEDVADGADCYFIDEELFE